MAMNRQEQRDDKEKQGWKDSEAGVYNPPPKPSIIFDRPEKREEMWEDYEKYKQGRERQRDSR